LLPDEWLAEPDEETGLNESVYMMSEFCHVPGAGENQITDDAMTGYIREADAVLVHASASTEGDPFIDPNDTTPDRVTSFAVGRFADTKFILDAFCVHPMDRGRGEGRAMLEKIKTFAKANGKTELYLSSLPSSTEFYRRVGFAEVPDIAGDFVLQLGGRRGRTFRRKPVRRNKYGSRLARKSQRRIRNRHA
jgi:GNAT superfamily N-acetyltransferase